VNKIKVGFFSVTECDDPERYVRWHQLDHMPEQFRLPGLSWGQRFFATERCVVVSAHREGSMANARHVQNYLFENYQPVMAEFSALGRALDGVGRYDLTPIAHVQAPFQLVQTYASPRVLISPEAVAYRPNTGIYLLVEDAASDAEPVDEWKIRQHAEHSAPLLAVPGVVGMWSYAAVAYPGSDTSAYGIPASTLLVTAIYLDADPVDVSEALRPHLARRWSDAPVQPKLAGAFRSYFPPPVVFCADDEDEGADG
jgi:hypothetical protein